MFIIVLRNQLANTTEQAGTVLSSKTVHGEIEKRAYPKTESRRDE
jgi:hypothetical protein